ncbi:MAG: hypothetical protein HXY24_10270 [Rubrivivax sp.]|nr:hypothetical protein [Rubrivivax sp.]
MQSKIFGIGLSKTGTSSLAQALQRLGFRTKDCMGASRYVPGDLSSIDLDTVLAHDALTDTPIPSFYRELDARFPGSKFILTVRERAGWLQSCRKQFNERSAAAQSEAHRRLFEDLYGTNVFDEERFSRGYDRFVAGVRKHFEGRPGDLLELDVSAGEGWEKLCPFLGRPVPDAPFPKANVTQIRWIDIEDLVSIAEAAGQELLKHFDGDVAPAAKRRPSLAPVGLVRRALRVTVGADGEAAAARAALKVIAAGLQKRVPGTPVVDSLDEPSPFAERRRWNHLWLVDPLDGRDAFANGAAAFSVNLALVEDGVPIYGVVHAPALGVTYYGRRGKGAFRRRPGEPATRLPASADASALTAESSTPAGPASSHALRICAALERADGATTPEWPAMTEWCAAAGHAVVGASEAWALVGADGAEPAYNSEHLQVGPHRIVLKAAA